MGTIRTGGLRRLAAGAVLAAAFHSAHANDVRDQAIHAGVADGVSTAMGLAAGAVELNPLGPVLAVGMKFAMFQYAKTLPDTEQPAVYAAAASVWGGAAANNLCVTASIVSGGAFAPACVAVGIAWGLKTWKESERERQFWEGCALLRQYANEPQLACIYTPAAPAAVEALAAVRPEGLEAP